MAERGHRGPRWLTWANAITGLRLASAPICAAAIVAGEAAAATAIFCLAVASDFADGRVARRLGDASPLGGLLDHATDAAFVSIGLGALSHGGQVPVWLPPLVALAFVQYAVDSRAIAGRALRASQLGRVNGIAYYVLLGTPLARDSLGLSWPGPDAVLAAGWVLVASTLASMADRLRAVLR